MRFATRPGHDMVRNVTCGPEPSQPGTAGDFVSASTHPTRSDGQDRIPSNQAPREGATRTNVRRLGNDAANSEHVTTCSPLEQNPGERPGPNYCHRSGQNSKLPNKPASTWPQATGPNIKTSLKIFHYFRQQQAPVLRDSRARDYLDQRDSLHGGAHPFCLAHTPCLQASIFQTFQTRSFDTKLWFQTHMASALTPLKHC